MTFDDLSKYVDQLATQRGYVSQDAVSKTINEKASGVEEYVNKTLVGHAHIATKAPRLTIRHFKKFGDELDVDELVDYAVKHDFRDLDKAYESYTQPKVRELEQKDVEAKLKAAREDGIAEGLKQKGMGSQSMPTDDEGPTMGHFQRRMLGIDKKDSGGEVEGNPDLGAGSIAVQAARNWDSAAGN